MTSASSSKVASRTRHNGHTLLGSQFSCIRDSGLLLIFSFVSGLSWLGMIGHHPLSPLNSHMVSRPAQSNTSVSYSGLGSARGVCRIKNATKDCATWDTLVPQTIDFAASDSVLTPEEYTSYPNQRTPCCYAALFCNGMGVVLVGRNGVESQ